MALINPARQSTEVVVGAVAARNPRRAHAFAEKHGIATVHGSYDALLAAPDIDAIYNPLPNALHGRCTRAALAAGKHVLCEKPLTANAAEAREIAALAEESGLVVMEAFHYRYHPLALRIEEIIASGELGTLTRVEATLCYPLPKFSDIRYDYALGGGAMMDAGCYTVHMARTFGGETPEVVSAQAKLHDPRIDAMSADTCTRSTRPCRNWDTGSRSDPTGTGVANGSAVARPTPTSSMLSRRGCCAMDR